LVKEKASILNTKNDSVKLKRCYLLCKNDGFPIPREHTAMDLKEIKAFISKKHI
jgi:hypothetical protein